MTFDHAADTASPARLERLHPGSWINSIFATWIGHYEKSHAWEVLAAVRTALAGAGGEPPPSLLLAEGSDWFWWLGDDNPTELAPLYDTIFRRHLADACRQADIKPPRGIDHPLKTAVRRAKVPVATRWQPPRLDGRITSYFEWCLSTQIELDGDHPIRRVSFWGGKDRFHLLIEGTRAMSEVIADTQLRVRFEPEDGPPTAIAIDGDGCRGRSADCNVGRVVELSLPWDSRRTARLDLRCGERSALDGAVLLLEPTPVDEDPV
jgi:hypothetical protein